MDAEVTYSLLDREWLDAGLVFDSAVWAKSGGIYKWTYRGKMTEPALQKIAGGAE